MKGLVHPIMEVTSHMDENGGPVEKLIDCTEKSEAVADEKVCHCQCSCSVENHFHVSLKEPLSAPF